MKKQNKNNRDTSLISRDTLLMQQRRNLDFIIIFFYEKNISRFWLPLFWVPSNTSKKIKGQCTFYDEL